MVTGAPSTTMLVGDSVRLVATAVNATGGIVSDQRVSWKSSAPTVAAVSNTGTVIALAAGKATITASAGGHDGTADFDIADGFTVGPLGAVLSMAAGRVTLSIPSGSLAQPVLLVGHPASNTPADSRVVANTSFSIDPATTVFTRPATLTMSYDAASLPSGVVESSLQLYALGGSGWVVVPGSTVDVSAKRVTGTIGTGGVYCVRSTPVARIVLHGAVAGGALYTGQIVTLSATVFAVNGDSLAPQPVSWSSSDPSKVTIDAGGKVVAVASGTATITAKADTATVTAAVTVLAHPTANWSRATDWTTFQGDARHTGFIDATLDPLVFAERWVKTPSGAQGYNPPTVGNGRLYLSTNTYNGAQQLVTLDAVTGASKWVRDFGTIFGINQPTYDNGSVYMTSGGHEDTYMWAMNEADGSLRFQAPFQSQWEHWKAPVIAGSTVVTAGGYYGGMYGFDKTTGAQTFFLSGPQVDSWAPAVSKGGIVYRTGGTGVTGVDPTDGTVAASITDSRLTAVLTPVIGANYDLLVVTSNRLMSVDLTARTVSWDQSGAFSGTPVVGGGVVYASSGTGVAARSESDGSALWLWTPPAALGTTRTLALTDNLLFVSAFGGGGPNGVTYAIDLASHLTVWSYPMGGDMAISAQGILYITHNGQVAAVAVR